MDTIDSKAYDQYGLKRFRLQDESGQTVVLAAFCMALLLGFIALAIDVGILFHTRRMAQTAADSGAIAAAEEMNYGDVTTAARTDAALNGVADGVQGASVIVNQPPSSGPYAGDTGYVEVLTKLPQVTFFMSLFGTRAVSAQGRAVAAAVPTQTCIFTLDPTSTSFEMSGGANVQMPGCGVLDESSSSTALQVSGGSTLNVGSIGVVGGYSSTGGGSISPQPATGVGPTSDPLLNLEPPSFYSSSCLANPNIGNGQQSTLGSGGTTCYNGLTIGGGSTVNLNPGIYVVNGTFSVSNGAYLIGEGVTFYLTQGSVSIGGGSVINLVAPTAGLYNGILFFQDRMDTQSASISNGASSVLEGILYFPAAPLAFDGGTSTRTYATVIANILSFSGGTTLKNYSIVNPVHRLLHHGWWNDMSNNVLSIACRQQIQSPALSVGTKPNIEDAGQALVELALVLPIFMLILVGAVECARLAYAWIEVANAARAGVQYGAQNHVTEVDFAGMAQAAIQDGANLTTLTATAKNFCRCSDGATISCAHGSSSCSAHVLNYVQVNTSASIEPLLYLPGLPKIYTLQGQAIMRVEQ